jgi:hypothetical protein
LWEYIFEEPVQKSPDARRGEHPSEGVLGSYFKRGRTPATTQMGFINRLLKKFDDEEKVISNE